MVVDDCSPERGLVADLKVACDELGFELVQRTRERRLLDDRQRRAAPRRSRDGYDAVLVNADIEFIDAGWLDAHARAHRHARAARPPSSARGCCTRTG